MINIQDIRSRPNSLIVIGNHVPIIQSILDFDYYSGRSEGSIVGIVTGRRGVVKYFWGRSEILLPTFSTTPELALSPKTNLWFLNLLSGRRTLSSVTDLVTSKKVVGGVIFAENVPELHAQQLLQKNYTNTLLIGPASVGLLVPGALKLGPIGGITPDQIREAELTKPGSVAVLSASGGMTNELINISHQVGHHPSFALSFGGDRFPILSPSDAFLLAESDPKTQTVLYYGELGGDDEYELVKLKKEGKFTKKVIAHIAGTVASLFVESPQFGHAKAKADRLREAALAKREALKEAGFQVSSSFSEFIKLVGKVK
jgi:ATP citrate (pro-S)-lyase